MHIFKDISSLQRFLKKEKYGNSVGFVPTMGALHEGHISLVAASKRENDLTVCSIFVNPKQFNNRDDLKKYPRDIERDKELLKNSGCDVLFLPSELEMYNENDPLIRFSFGYLEDVMEGRYRPGHFNGVAIVVLKLFNIVTPEKAYFGQKDLQQFVIIQKLVEELNFKITLRRMPIIRDLDGLAMSSRNMRLTPNDRKAALIFSKALYSSKEMLLNNKPVSLVRQYVEELFNVNQEANLEYFEIVNAQSLMPVSHLRNDSETALCIAGYVSNIRLIDNIII